MKLNDVMYKKLDEVRQSFMKLHEVKDEIEESLNKSEESLGKSEESLGKSEESLCKWGKSHTNVTGRSGQNTDKHL